MTFFSVLFALFIEQMRALAPHNPVVALFRQHAHSVRQRYFNAGQSNHGVWAWLAVVLPWTLAVALIYYMLYKVSFILAFAWNVLVLYFTLGFRQFSYYFTDIQHALNSGDTDRARQILHQWTGMDTTVMSVSEIARHTLIRAIMAAHRHVFGVFFWFLLPFGPAGAVLYRTAEYIARTWSGSAPGDSRSCARFAQHAFWIIDWLPVRLSGLSFAIVGNFEEAMHNWRQAEQQKPLTNEAILIAAGSGALGICLDVPQSTVSNEGAETPLLNTNAPVPLDEHQNEPNDTPSRALQSAAGLGWRAVVLWMILLLIVTLSIWFG